MNYSEIINELKKYDLIKKYDEQDMFLSYLSYNSNDIKPNTLFVC